MIKSKQIQRPMLVLVVDDHELNRDILGMILEDHYEVLYAEDGVQAMEVVAERYTELSVVLLDLIMPRMNGFEVLKRLKEDDNTRHIPVVVLTAEKDAELEALKMGASDFITKPFDVHEVILARVSRIIELSEGRQLISAAEYDRLTNLYTRNFFFEYADRMFKYHSEMHMDAVVLNIEQFHIVNALNGRDFGDKVLRIIGDEIRKILKETEGIAGRFEADRFDIYCVKQDSYMALLDRIQSRVDGVSNNISIHMRMGVRPWCEGVEPVLLFDGARAACNMVRGNFQHPLMIYDEEMRKRELLNQRLLNDLRSAIDEKQFKVYFQPKYDIRCEPPKLSSAEALIRWQHPELGMISPGQFIPLFEGNGLISMVDWFVYEETAAQIAAWREKYGVSVPISVNLSRSDIYDASIVDRLADLAARNGLRFKDLKLEVTESAYTDNVPQLLDVISHLRSMGFEVEMDDFGSGYSSLNMLSAMPIDVLKMDMKFVRNIENNQTDMRLVKLIIDIARSMNLLVVAEGVETEGQMKLLKEAGCDLIQGYYFSRPLPVHEFEELMTRELLSDKNQ